MANTSVTLAFTGVLAVAGTYLIGSNRDLAQNDLAGTKSFLENPAFTTAMLPEGMESGYQAEPLKAADIEASKGNVISAPADLHGFVDHTAIPYQGVAYFKASDPAGSLVSDIFGEIDYNDEAELRYPDTTFTKYDEVDYSAPNSQIGVVIEALPPYKAISYSTDYIVDFRDATGGLRINDDPPYAGIRYDK